MGKLQFVLVGANRTLMRKLNSQKSEIFNLCSHLHLFIPPLLLPPPPPPPPPSGAYQIRSFLSTLLLFNLEVMVRQRERETVLTCHQHIFSCPSGKCVSIGIRSRSNIN